MSHQSELIATDIHSYLKQQEEKSMLRFITCGSVDDGKSTLIGRLLWDSKMVFEDQLAALTADSKRVGTQGENIDYALLLDGLQAEREQGITIDVAYRYFSTDKRKFIVADTPGHEQYTRNMVTGASTAQVAVILIDARKGVLTQTRRHSYLVSLVGIRHVVLAINKMDLVDYSAKRFDTIRKEYQLFASGLGFEDITAIPISALEGDNVLSASHRTAWYEGPTLMEYLETVRVEDAAAARPFRLPVQWVNRPHLDFRGFSGTIASGTIRTGDEIVVTSSGQTSRVARIVTMDGDLQEAVAGQAVTLTLTDEIDISRGDLLATPEQRPQHSDQLEAKLVWLHEQPLSSSRSYVLKSAAGSAPAQVREVKCKVNVNSLQQEPGTSLALNEVGVCHIAVSKKLDFDAYRENGATGSFILIDRLTHATVAAGMIDGALASVSETPWTSLCLDRAARAGTKEQQPKVLWFSGFDRQGQQNLPQLLEKKLHSLGRHTYLLDSAVLGESLRGEIGEDGTLRRVQLKQLLETAHILVDAGLIVLVAADVDLTRASRIAGNILDSEDCLEICHADAGAGETFTDRIMVCPTESEHPEKLIERLSAELLV
ncbi:sulfate adenylyltransferase, subunit 1 [Syntrophotalea carbinolica DSM 2380]|uniref:Sulfate adenylyltransferase subunit 1 n=1 Tax=Syntrophotalea carbinolica (strain DSM 2380 / NBRC 103641 / GraBd1) TaxID=338963 RepID=Q3A3P6_SYNC1|nr:sulfate adenylyltransferase subunit CysN [Syntrophotalea carbinolica]ABA89011.1 sulfate adenylyltransferase, subunit 1 [Syntrophotalea carbinolica DSM 2380]